MMGLTVLETGGALLLYRDWCSFTLTFPLNFYENRRNAGYRQVGYPIRVDYPGKLKIMDYDNDGKMDVVVEIAPGIHQVVYVGDIFGVQGVQMFGKRRIHYAMFDHLGSTKLLVDEEGDITWPETGTGASPNELLPFGKDLDFDPDNPDPVEAEYRLTFTNKEIDDELDLHYFGARYYNSTLPRFISPDPVNGTPKYPLSWNRYLYCRNDPINYFDPTGEQTTQVDDDLQEKEDSKAKETDNQKVESQIEWKRKQAEAVNVDTGANPDNLDGEKLCYELMTAVTLAAGTASLAGGLGDDALRGLRSTKLTRGGSKKLGKLEKLKDADIAEAIIYRGGNASNVRKAVGNSLRGKTVGEVANLAAQGDKHAQTAVKILKQAAKKGQKY